MEICLLSRREWGTARCIFQNFQAQATHGMLMYGNVVSLWNISSTLGWYKYSNQNTTHNTHNFYRTCTPYINVSRFLQSLCWLWWWKPHELCDFLCLQCSPTTDAYLHQTQAINGRRRIVSPSRIPNPNPNPNPNLHFLGNIWHPLTLSFDWSM